MPKPSAISVPRLPVPPSPRPTALLPFSGPSAPLPKSAEPIRNNAGHGGEPNGDPYVPANPFRVTPVVAHTVAGCRPRAPLNDAEAARVMASFERDILARSTALTRASNVRTWIFFHVRWFGEGTPVLPLTPGIIFAIAAQFKAQGYRSFPNYVSAMKDVHSDEYPWSAELARALKRAAHSTQRGIGPPKQCAELPVHRLLELRLDDSPLVDGGPINPLGWATLSAFHILRGAESASALAESLSVNATALSESWLLTASKTDPQAIGVTRTWGCVCSGVAPSLCPYHAAVHHLDLLQKKFGTAEGVLPLDCPLFPNEAGGRHRQLFGGNANVAPQ